MDIMSVSLHIFSIWIFYYFIWKYLLIILLFIYVIFVNYVYIHIHTCLLHAFTMNIPFGFDFVGCAGWSGSMLVANPLCWFCHDAAQILLWHVYSIHVFTLGSSQKWLLFATSFNKKGPHLINLTRNVEYEASQTNVHSLIQIRHVQ
jgi:hypothetical protein